MPIVPVLLWFVVGSSVLSVLAALRTPGGPRGVYALLLIANTVLAGLILSRDLYDSPAVYLAIGAYLLLVPAPPLLAAFARRALGNEHVGLAARLLWMREVLMPSPQTRFEREQVEALANVRAGRGEEAIDKLKKNLSAVEDPRLKRLWSEQLVSLMVFDRRFSEALAYYDMIGGARLSPPLSPPVVAQLVRAAVEEENVEEAAELLLRLEQGPYSQRPEAQPLIAQARLFFLAGLGRIEDVIAITGSGGSGPAGAGAGAGAGTDLAGTPPLKELPARARAYWIGIAAARQGDRDQARSELARAVELSRGDAGGAALAKRRLSDLDAGKGVGPVAVPETVSRLADRVSELARSARIPRVVATSVRAPVTLGFIAVNALIYILIESLASTTDPIALITAGANVPMLVRAGELWRLVTANFLHIGIMHVLLNLYSLWILGRLVEPRLGRARFFAIYMAAGIGGALASFLHAKATLSAGASGAIFGLLGAAIAVFWREERSLPERFRRQILANLIFLAGLNVALGLAIPQIDQAAHLGGFVTGFILTLLIVRSSPLPRVLAQALAGLLLVGSVGSLGYGAWGVYQNLQESRVGVTYAEDGAAVTVPHAWSILSEPGKGMHEPENGGELKLGALGASAPDLESFATQHMNAELAEMPGLCDTSDVTYKVVPAGPDWAQRELDCRVAGGSERARMIVVLHRAPDGQILALWFRTARSDLADVRASVQAVIATLRPASR